MASTRRRAAIMFTDVVGFTAAAQADESGALARRREQEGLVRPLLGVHGGREVKSTGDGLLVEFGSALRATECAVEIQRRLHERDAERPSHPTLLRISVHVGDVEAHSGDVFGDTVNVAARLLPLADPGGVCVSEHVAAQVRTKLPYPLEKIPHGQLKGLREPIDVFRVRLPWAGREATRPDNALPRLAVLPLANISQDPRDDYFADGLTEELISVLSQFRGLRVIARTTVGQYKATSKSIAEIGQELGVNAVLEGSVRKAGNRIRVSLQLIDVPTQEHTWSESYNRELDDVFAIQAEIAERTSAALKLGLAQGELETIRRPRASGYAAYDLYLRAIDAFRRLDPEANAEAVRCLEESIRLDPEFALAHAHLANTLVQGAGDFYSGRDAFPRARVHVARALALDPDSAEAHLAQGNVATQADQDWVLAESEYTRAIARNPSSSAAHGWFAVLLVALQRFEEANEILSTATALDPYWDVLYRWKGTSFHRQGDLDSEAQVLQRAAKLFPAAPWQRVARALGHLATGRASAARQELETVPPQTAYASVLAAFLFPAVGRAEEAHRILTEWVEAARTRFVPADRIASLYAALGEGETCLDLLERNSRMGERTLWYGYQGEQYDAIRTNPRFAEMIASYRLPSSIRRPLWGVDWPKSGRSV